MNDYDVTRETDALRAQFEAAGKTLLPPPLCSDALFARMDAGSLTLPEEAAPAAEATKVLRGPWRHWGTLAAAVLVVVSLFAAGRSGLLGGDSGIAANDGLAPESPEFRLEASGFYVPIPGEDYEKFADGAMDNESGVPNGLLQGMVTAAIPELTDADADEAMALLGRQSWQAAEAAAPGAWTFRLYDADYSFDPETRRVDNCTEGLTAVLSAEDAEALLVLCQSAE